MAQILGIPMMHRRVVVAATLGIFAGCSTNYRDYQSISGFSLRPGAHLPNWVSGLATVHRGGTRCAHQATVNGVLFYLDVPCGTDRIIFVMTGDPKFRTAEGLAVGDEIAKARAVPNAVQLGDSCDIKLPSGWTAECDEGTPPKIDQFSAPPDM
jgi:hypothetical protein